MSSDILKDLFENQWGNQGQICWLPIAHWNLDGVLLLVVVNVGLMTLNPGNYEDVADVERLHTCTHADCSSSRANLATFTMELQRSIEMIFDKWT